MSSRIVKIYRDYALDKFRGNPDVRTLAEEWLDRYFGGQGLQV